MKTASLKDEPMNEIPRIRRADIPPPPRMNRRPRDERGFIVPWFVHQDSETGAYDFRVIRKRGIEEAMRRKSCWLCGEQLGRFQCFTIGPMCVINRISSEPPAHLECAVYAVRVCPFLTQPRMRRNTKDMPAGTVPAGGIPVERNAGGAVIYTTRTYETVRAYHGNAGVLLRLGEPESVEWFTQGRPATREEAEALLADGETFLLDAAVKMDGPTGVEHCVLAVEAARALLPAKV